MSRRNNISNLTLFINTYNEEKNIKKCLENLKWIKEIYILDTLSSDRTIEIANKYTKNINIHKFTNFESQRNYAISNIKSNWILMIDADETLSPGADKKIIKLIKESEYEGYWFQRKQFINSKNYLKSGYFYPDWQLRLFRNDKGFKFKGNPHHVIQIPHNQTKRINSLFIIHNPSHSKYSSYLAFFRFVPYIKIEGRELTRTPVANLTLLKNFFVEPLRHFYRSFIKLKGYIDGYYGFRAAINFGLYQGSINFYALYLRIIKSK